MEVHEEDSTYAHYPLTSKHVSMGDLGAGRIRGRLDLMIDKPDTQNRPTRILEHDASREEAVAWFNEFERCFTEKETQIIKRGYSSVIHGRMVLNRYIDRNIKTRLKRDEPLGAGLPVRGPKGFGK